MPKKIKIIFVDGYNIRNTIDPDFTILHLHSLGGFAPKFYIPKNEIWIERRLRDEADFLIKHERRTARLMKNKTYHEAREILKKDIKPGAIPTFIKSEEVTKDGIVIKFVDGGIVRRHLDPEFALGGHGYVYDYVPKKEIWIDAKMDPREYKYTLLHELTEREKMRKGESYDNAHDFATVTEKKARRLDQVASYPGDAK